MPVTNIYQLYAKAITTGAASVAAALPSIRSLAAFDTDGVIIPANQGYLNTAKTDYTDYLQIKDQVINSIDNSVAILQEYQAQSVAYERDYAKLIAISKSFGAVPV